MVDCVELYQLCADRVHVVVGSRPARLRGVGTGFPRNVDHGTLSAWQQRPYGYVVPVADAVRLKSDARVCHYTNSVDHDDRGVLGIIWQWRVE